MGGYDDVHLLDRLRRHRSYAGHVGGVHAELDVAVGVRRLERRDRPVREPPVHLVGVHHPALDAVAPVAQHDDAVGGEAAGDLLDDAGRGRRG